MSFFLGCWVEQKSLVYQALVYLVGINLGRPFNYIFDGRSKSLDLLSANVGQGPACLDTDYMDCLGLTSYYSTSIRL